jgi:sporulation protein YqfC
MKKRKWLPDLPPSAVGQESLIEMHGSEYMIIDGCRGVLIYDECLIKLALKKRVLSVCGTALELMHLTPTCASVSGHIQQVTFGE